MCTPGIPLRSARRNRLRAAHTFRRCPVHRQYLPRRVAIAFEGRTHSDSCSCSGPLVPFLGLSQSPSSGALIRTVWSADQPSGAEDCVAIAFQRRTHSDWETRRARPIPLRVAIAFQRRTHSDLVVEAPKGIRGMSQSPSSGALIRTLPQRCRQVSGRDGVAIAFQRRTHSDAAMLFATLFVFCRNRLPAAHSFGPRLPYKPGKHECLVAIAFQRRTHSDREADSMRCASA